jgi:hypothetical protein
MSDERKINHLYETSSHNLPNHLAQQTNNLAQQTNHLALQISYLSKESYNIIVFIFKKRTLQFVSPFQAHQMS